MDTLSYKPQQPTIPLFALTKGSRSKRQLSKSFTVVIQPSSTRLIKPKISVYMEVGDPRQVREPVSPYKLSFLFYHVYMIGWTTLLGELPGVPGRVTLSARDAFCHVNVSRWGNPPCQGRVHVTLAMTSRNFTPGPWGCKFACKRGLFFDYS